MTRALVAAALLVSSLAWADQPVDRPESFEVDRDRPPPGQAELGFDAGAQVNGWAASVQLGYLDHPFDLQTTQVHDFPIRHRETLGLGVVYGVTPDVLFDAYMPFAHQVGDRLVGLGDNHPLDRFVVGDLAIGGRLRLARREHAQLLARAQITLPTGDNHDFAGEARWTAAWMLIARFTLPHGFVVAANAGVFFRFREVQVADRLLGDELRGALGITYELPAIHGLWCPANHVRVTGELDGVLGNDVAGQRGPSPAEVRVGMISDIREWLSIAGRVGIGIDDQIGAPRGRVLVEVVYRPQAF